MNDEIDYSSNVIVYCLNEKIKNRKTHIDGQMK